MIALLYALMLGPACWPVSLLHTYVIGIELVTECTALWGAVLYGLFVSPRRSW